MPRGSRKTKQRVRCVTVIWNCQLLLHAGASLPGAAAAVAASLGGPPAEGSGPSWLPSPPRLQLSWSV